MPSDDRGILHLRSEGASKRLSYGTCWPRYTWVCRRSTANASALRLNYHCHKKAPASGLSNRGVAIKLAQTRAVRN
jgi:hypothetical protein